METATISQFRSRLSFYLKKVRDGQALLITDRGRAMARIEPVTDASTEERLSRLERVGLVRRGAVPLALGELRRRAPNEDVAATRALIEERSRGR